MRERVGRAMYGEYLATRALALAGDKAGALAVAQRAKDTTQAGDTRVLSEAARAIGQLDASSGSGHVVKSLLDTASRLDIWDGVVCAVRAAPALLSQLVLFPEHKAQLREVLLRSNDLTLAKSAGLVTRSTGVTGVLSRREREIMEHVRQGKKNAEIASSLFIATATVKRHLDHVYDKLGARTRVEAIARYAEIETGEIDDGFDS